MSDHTGPRSPFPTPSSTTGTTPGAPAEPRLPQHGTPIGGTPPGGISPATLPPSGPADFPPPMTAGSTHPGGAGTPGASEAGSRGGQRQDAGARMLDTAGALKDEGAEALGTLKREGDAVLDAAQQRASTMFEQQKRAGADQAEGVAQAVHKAADQLQETSPQIAGYVHEAASSVDRMARTLRDRGPGQLLHDVQDLARRQPVAFFGAAVLAGFAIARFARASSPAGAAAGGIADRRGMSGGMDSRLDRDVDRAMDDGRATATGIGSTAGTGTNPMGAAGTGPGGPAAAASPGWTSSPMTRGEFG
jgi:hypothetical protein